MAQNSKIEWTTHTANLWSGCTKVHEGCDNCYAETLSKRWGNDVWGNDKPRKEVKSVWNDLAKYLKVAQVRDLLNQVINEKISFSRFVEILNENKQPITLNSGERLFTETEISQLQSNVHKITGDGEVMQLFNSLLGIKVG